MMNQITAMSASTAQDPAKSEAARVREAFTQFVGETFYAQLLKSMRSSVGKPAYFHGGRAEEIFTSQLDQTLAEQLASKSSERLIDPLFERQFPRLAEQLNKEKTEDATDHGQSRIRLG